MSPHNSWRPTVLIIEDEEVIGMALAESLREIGFDVRLLNDGRSARCICEEQIAAAIIDVGLPDCRGNDLARQYRASHPELPIILATGYNRRHYEREFADDVWVRVLGKPYSVAELLAQLADLLVQPLPLAPATRRRSISLTP